MPTEILNNLLREVMAVDYSLKFLQETVRVWQPHYEKELTIEDAREITSNMIKFFGVLAEWEEEDSLLQAGPLV